MGYIDGTVHLHHAISSVILFTIAPQDTAPVLMVRLDENSVLLGSGKAQNVVVHEGGSNTKVRRVHLSHLGEGSSMVTASFSQIHSRLFYVLMGGTDSSLHKYHNHCQHNIN